MTDNGVTCRMSRSGDVWDDAAIESFFASLEPERIARRVYRTRVRPGPAFDCIERLHNSRRRHSTIRCVSPLEFELITVSA
jgi:putative transposase